jgi:hypothetical protein
MQHISLLWIMKPVVKARIERAYQVFFTAKIKVIEVFPP